MIILWFRDFLRKSKIFKSNLCNLVRYLCVNLAPELKGNIIQYAQYKKIESWPCFDTKKTFALKLLIQFYPFTVTAVLLFCKAKWNNLVEYEVLSHLIFYLLEQQRISICPARVIATGLRLTLLCHFFYCLEKNPKQVVQKFGQYLVYPISLNPNEPRKGNFHINTFVQSMR